MSPAGPPGGALPHRRRAGQPCRACVGVVGVVQPGASASAADTLLVSLVAVDRAGGVRRRGQLRGDGDPGRRAAGGLGRAAAHRAGRRAGGGRQVDARRGRSRRLRRRPDRPVDLPGPRRVLHRCRGELVAGAGRRPLCGGPGGDADGHPARWSAHGGRLGRASRTGQDGPARAAVRCRCLGDPGHGRRQRRGRWTFPLGTRTRVGRYTVRATVAGDATLSAGTRRRRPR